MTLGIFLSPLGIFSLQFDFSGSFFFFSLNPQFVNWVDQLAHNLPGSACLAPAPPFSLFLCAKITGWCHHTQVYVASEVMNSGPHILMAGILLTEPCPEACSCLFLG